MTAPREAMTPSAPTKIIGTSDCRETPNSEYRFFLYDPEDMGLMFYRSAEIRDQVAAHGIRLYCDGDGWSEEVARVCAGEVTAFVTKTDVTTKPVRSEFDSDEDYEDAMEEWPSSDFDEMCNYELQSLAALAPQVTP